MQHVKCLKCAWKGSSVDTFKQWFPTVIGNKEFDAITTKLLMICPECEVGVCIENKVKI